MEAAKVILAGHTGTEKAQVAAKLEAYLPEVREDWANRIKVVDLEDCLRRSAGGVTGLFAGVRNTRLQRTRWLEGWRLARDEFARSGAHCQILVMHVSFATRDIRTCPADLAAVARWGPDIIITLIDDVYSVKRRIQLKRYPFTLGQLCDWRTTEQMLADQVAVLRGSLGAERGEAAGRALCESLVLAVKTPLVTAARLIGKVESRRAYASYPITSTRGSPVLKEEIDGFRRRLHETMPTFDPLTIEELPLLSHYVPGHGAIEYSPYRGAPGHADDEASKRWDARLGPGPLAPLVWEPGSAKDATGAEVEFFPVEIERGEIDELSLPEEGEGYTTIHDQLTVRDLRLVAQSDVVVCYRPYLGGSISGGVNTEIQNANTLQKEVVAYVGNDKLPGKPLRGHIDKRFEEAADFWGYLEQIAAEPVELPRAGYY